MPSVLTDPLSQRLAVLERLWQEFRRMPNACLCRWLFSPDEEWLLDIFLQEQAGPDAISNDIFLTIRAPVQHWQTYFDHARDELAELIDHDLALLAERNLVLTWSSRWGKSAEDPLTRFVDYLNRFANGLCAHTGGVLVVCLLPQTYANHTVLDQMLTALLQAGLSANVRVLVADTTGQERLTTLAGRFGTAIHSNPVALQLHKVIRQLAAIGEPMAPDVKFRQWNAELTAAIAQRNLRDVAYFANNCLLICQQEQWHSLGGSVHLSVAHAYADHHRYEDALARYNQVIDQMEDLFSRGDEVSGQISIMAWLGAGGVYDELRQRQRAIDCYELASQRAEALQQWLLAIESHRRLGVIQESRAQVAETHYRRLFELAEQLPPEQHRMARLSELGRTYWQQQQTPEKRRTVDALLSQLLGPDWRKAAL